MFNINDFEQLAKQSLDSSIFDFFYGGANDEITLKENLNAYNKITLSPRVLKGVQNPDTTISFFGNTLDMPILIAPMAFQKLANPQGEVETAKGASLANTIMTGSTYSTTLLSNIAAELSIPPWFQLYILKDRGITRSIIELAESTGCKALVITVDAPIYGKRERELKAPLEFEIILPDLLAITAQLYPAIQLKYAKDISTFLAPNISWQDIEWVKSITKLPIFLKGILGGDDAVLAASYGVYGVIISNHGGRQLDTTPAAICVLPKIAQAVEGTLEILIDGGIRRGTDILKALALGAKAVFVGRPVIWGLAADGHRGVYNVLNLLNEELKTSMVLCGCGKLSDITSDIIYESNKI